MEEKPTKPLFNVLARSQKERKGKKKHSKSSKWIPREEHFLLWRDRLLLQKYSTYLTLPKYLTEVNKVNKVSN